MQPLSSAPSDDESRWVAKAVIGLIVLGIVPLILFHLVVQFNPDFLRISVTPQ